MIYVLFFSMYMCLYFSVSCLRKISIMLGGSAQIQTLPHARARVLIKGWGLAGDLSKTLGVLGKQYGKF